MVINFRRQKNVHSECRKHHFRYPKFYNFFCASKLPCICKLVALLRISIFCVRKLSNFSNHSVISNYFEHPYDYRILLARNLKIHSEIFNCPPPRFRGETRALMGGGGGVNIHIFLFCPTNFF